MHFFDKIFTESQSFRRSTVLCGTFRLSIFSVRKSAFGIDVIVKKVTMKETVVVIK